MKLSASIMAHRAREDAALATQAAVSTPDHPVPICWDPKPTPSADPAQRWVTGRLAWEAHDPDADWHMVLQDDVAVCADLMVGLEKALDQVGKLGLVSAYTGTGRPRQANVRRALAYADKHGHSWMSTMSLNWGPAIIAPTSTIADMLKWCSTSRRWTRPSREPKNYDYRVGVFYRDRMRWRTWYTVPSLVDHQDVPSLVGHGGGRVAHRFLGETNSALEVDWSSVPTGGLSIDLLSPKR